MTTTNSIIHIYEKMVRDLEAQAETTNQLDGLIAGAKQNLADARADHRATLNVGDAVTTSGFHGVITDVPFPAGMIEVTLASGVVVVTSQDVVKV